MRLDREMRYQKYTHNTSAVSEIMGGLMLLLVAMLVFVAIYNFIFPLPDSDIRNSNVKISGYVASDGSIILEHLGGEVLTKYKIIVMDENDSIIGSTLYSHQNDWFAIGKKIIPTTMKLKNENDSVHILIIDKEESEELVFDGVLFGKPIIAAINQSEIPTLISSLFTDTSCEDLIFNEYSLKPNIVPKTYIVNWFVNGKSIYEILMTFDTNNSILTKDYSGNNNNGTITGAKWINTDKNNGAIYFDGDEDSITMDAPEVLVNMSTSDFTITFLIKSYDTLLNHKVILEGGGLQDFITIFQYDNQIHAGFYVDGVKQAVRTDNITNHTWYHIAVVWDSSEKQGYIYCDGILSLESGYRTFSMGSKEVLELGHGSTSSGFYFGLFDQLEVFNRALSEEQIYQSYLSSVVGNKNQ
jgi:hypothetical protein